MGVSKLIAVVPLMEKAVNSAPLQGLELNIEADILVVYNKSIDVSGAL